MNSKVRTIIFTAICLMMAIPAKMTAQDVVVTDLPLLHEMIEGREVRARYIFLENFAYGDKGTELFYKPVSDAYYVINAIDCYDENDEYYPIFSVMDEDLRYGVIDRSGNLVIPQIYTKMDRATGKKFGHDPDYFMYLRARRSDGGKDYYDYFYAKSLKLVYTCEAD